MINLREETSIRKWHDMLDRDIRVRLMLTEDSRSEQFAAFADRMAALAPKVHIRKEASDAMEMPALLIGETIRYHAIPSGKELEPFLDALTQADVPPASSGPVDPEVLRNIKLPADLELYIALDCGFCPAAVKRLIGLARHSPLIRLSIIDAFLFSERSKAHGIRSVPTILFDEGYRWTGNIDLEELVDAMIHRDPANLQASTIEHMITHGEASQVAELMRANGRIFPHFLELLFHEKWSVRLGAMVVMEEMIETDIGLVVPVVDALWAGSKTADDSVKGDIYYLLGEAADETMILNLQTTLSASPGKELKEVIEEAIERIEERCLR
jgi:hypothetical protein